MSILSSALKGAISSGLKQTVEQGVAKIDGFTVLNVLAPNFINPRSSGTDPTARIRGNDVVSKIQFPSDLGKYYMTMKFHDYKRPSVFADTVIDATDFIALPLPSSGLSDAYVLGYDGKSLSGSVGYLAEALTAKMNQGVNAVGAVGDQAQSLASVAGVGSQYSKLMNSASSIIPTEDQPLIKALGEAASGAAIASLISQAQNSKSGAGAAGLQLLGLAENPFLTVVFTGPQFKTHRFRWLLAPKNEQESTALTKIVNVFKKGAHPEVVKGIGAFKYPQVLHIAIKPDEAAANMNKFKPCVIESIDVNYSPSGQPSFFRGTSAPTMVELSLQLKEIEIWTQDDFDDAGLDFSFGDLTPVNTVNSLDSQNAVHGSFSDYVQQIPEIGVISLDGDA